MSQIKVLDIIHDSVVDGEGLRCVIFFAGCLHEPKCKGCHNPQSWDINNGKEMTVEEIINEIKSNPLCKGVTFSGGEPLNQSRRLIPLAKAIKDLGLNLWIYTGFTIEECEKLSDYMCELIQLADVLVDGRFIEEEKDLSLKFRGSKNQRILYKGLDF